MSKVNEMLFQTFPTVKKTIKLDRFVKFLYFSLKLDVDYLTVKTADVLKILFFLYDFCRQNVLLTILLNSF